MCNLLRHTVHLSRHFGVIKLQIIASTTTLDFNFGRFLIFLPFGTVLRCWFVVNRRQTKMEVSRFTVFFLFYGTVTITLLCVWWFVWRVYDVVWISWLLEFVSSNITVSRVDDHLVARLWLFPRSIPDCQQKAWEMVAGKSREFKIYRMFSSGRICLTQRRFPSAPEKQIAYNNFSS